MALLANTFSDPLLSNPGGIYSPMLPACPDLLTLQQAIVTTDVAGGTIYDWANATNVATNIPCNLQNASPRDIETFDRRGIKVSNRCYVPTGLVASLGQRIFIQRVPGVYYVVTFISDMGGENLAFKMYVNLIE